MADSDTTVVEPLVSKATPEVQATAEAMGWIPPKRFTGEVSRFVDAEEYVKRGETILPIVKQREKALRDEIAQFRTELSKRDKLLQEATDAIAEMQERHSVDTVKRVAEARKELLAQLKQAKRDEDVDAEVELTDQLTQLDKAVEVAPVKKKPAAEVTPTFTPPPEIVAFQQAHPWFGKDKRKTAIVIAAAEELRESGDTSTGDAFFKKILDAVEEVFPAEQRVSKVEGGARSGGAGASGSGNGKAFGDLPADAKEACHKDARDFVGKGKRYETMAQWEKRYAEIYFKE